MAKDSPYFKFYVSEYNDGDIQLCSMEAQGLFVNICSLYWSREGQLFLSKAKKLFKVRAKCWQELIEERAIKIQDDKIVINFLDEQLQERSKKAAINAKNGEKGGRPKSENNPAGLLPVSEKKANESNKEEKREEERREEEKRGEEIHPATFDLKFSEAFDENTLDGYKLAFRHLDLARELQLFRLKCDNDKPAYYHRDAPSLRTAFQYQLKISRNKKQNGTHLATSSIITTGKDFGTL